MLNLTGLEDYVIYLVNYKISVYLVGLFNLVNTKLVIE